MEGLDETTIIHQLMKDMMIKNQKKLDNCLIITQNCYQKSSNTKINIFKQIKQKRKKIHKIDNKHIQIIDNPKNDYQQDNFYNIYSSNIIITLNEIPKKISPRLANSNDKLEIVKLQTNEMKLPCFLFNF